MKEIGILYSTEMVRAKLDDRKSMTRRTRGLEEINQNPDDWMFIGMEYNYSRQRVPVGIFQNADGIRKAIKCPYGQPGDLHWVRETWNFLYRHKDSDQLCTKNDFVRIQNPEQWHPFRYVFAADNNGDNEPPSWKPSIHMPKSAARIWDEVVSVRAERLQDMDGATADECDSLKEGIYKIHQGDGNYGYSAFTNEPSGKNWVHPLYAFRELWANINGPDSWNHNPWVWVIGTKNLSKTGRP